MVKEKAKKSVKPEKKTPEINRQAQETGVVPRLYDRYKNMIVKEIMERYQFSNVMLVPRLEKISINVGVGQATQEPKLIDNVVKDLEIIVGQKVVVTRSKKDISNFKLRQGIPIGVKVTLRRKKMYEFLDRFINVTVPRIRDFRGFSEKSFDGHGNYTIGIKEHIIFPEIDVDKVTKVFGMDISLITTAKNDQQAYDLLKGFGMPFVKRQEIIEPKSA